MVVVTVEVEVEVVAGVMMVEADIFAAIQPTDQSPCPEGLPKSLQFHDFLFLHFEVTRKLPLNNTKASGPNMITVQAYFTKLRTYASCTRDKRVKG